MLSKTHRGCSSIGRAHLVANCRCLCYTAFMATEWKYRRVVAPPEYPGKRYMKKWCLEHHLVWWRATGQLVPEGFVVHHRNEDKGDNRIENLELLTNSQHSAQHAGDPTAYSDVTCGECKTAFRIRGNDLRRRLKQTRHGSIFCSKRCSVLHQHAAGRGRKRAGS